MIETQLNDLLKIKVCGLIQLEQIEELISMNTDFLGFIFYEKSPRFILNHLNIKQISEVAHQGKVGVFVNESLEKVAETAEKAKLNLIQLHGDEDNGFMIELRKQLYPEIKIIKAIRIGNQKSDQLQQTIDTNKSIVDYFLFDTDSAAFGGTGKTFDWNILNEAEIPFPYFLSGGISLENIENLKILKQKPFAIDINSRFETEPGIKDLEKIKILNKYIHNLSPEGTT